MCGGGACVEDGVRPVHRRLALTTSNHTQHHQVGPELELTGYGCEDHFLEPDTEAHAWDALAGLLSGGHTDG